MSTSDKPSRVALATITLIAVVQLILGVVFIALPQQFATVLGLAPAPAWTEWIFTQFGARALGFAFGMWLVLRDARRHADWIRAMIAVQTIDWIGTIFALLGGKVTLVQVATAPFLPILFIVVLALELLRQNRAEAQSASAT